MSDIIVSALAGAADLFQGTDDDDVLAADGGNDTIEGGGGNDVAVITGRNRGDAQVFGNSELAVVMVGGDVVELRDVETIRFDDVDVALTGDGELFAAPVIVATGETDGFQYVIDMASGDFNADGHVDLIAPLTFFPNTVRDNAGIVLLGDGNGGFAPAGGAVAGFVTEHARWTVVADFNGDGDDDVFVADHGFDSDPFPGHQNVLLLSDGNGRLTNASANLPQRMDFTHGAAAGDIDGDGDVDVIAANAGVADAPGPQVLVNNGNGGFQNVSGRLPGDFETAAAISYAVELIDVNGDGAPDLFLGAAQGNDAFIALNDGSGNFPNLAALPRPNFAVGGVIESYDLVGWHADNDGRLDLIVLSIATQPTFAGGYLQFLRQQPDGSFVDETAARFAQSADATGPLGYEVELADIDGDGDLDIVMRDPLRILLNQGDNTFVDGPDAPFDFLSNDFVTGDFNGDGAIDIAGFLNRSGGDYELHIAFNQRSVGLDSMALVGGDGADQQIGSGSADWFGAGAGDDSMWGLAGGDVMFGGNGADRLFGNRGDDNISGGADDDQVKAHPGDDTVAGDGGNDLLFGGGNDDNIDGGIGDDVANGNSGFDTVMGGAGNDTVRGQGGRDRLEGGDGDDLVVGMQGFDTLFGGAGNDTLIGGPANDTLTGGGDADTFTFAAGHGANVITDFADGTDKLLIQGAASIGELDIENSADGAVVTLASAGDGLSITLTGITANQLGAGDFLFG